MKEYIQESNKKILRENKEWFLFKKIPFIIINPFTNNIQVPKILSIIEGYLKESRYFSYIEGIYVGDFPLLKERNIQALFHDGVIYILNEQNVDENRIARDVIHEMGHSLEKEFGLDLYGDGVLRTEFLSKRKRIYALLNYDHITLPNDFLKDTEYNKNIDDILLKTIGYDKLNMMISGLFLSPYCIVSLSEYFSNGFEEMLCGDSSYVKMISPVLYEKSYLLNKIVKEEGDEYGNS